MSVDWGDVAELKRLQKLMSSLKKRDFESTSVYFKRMDVIQRQIEPLEAKVNTNKKIFEDAKTCLSNAEATCRMYESLKMFKKCVDWSTVIENIKAVIVHEEVVPGALHRPIEAAQEEMLVIDDDGEKTEETKLTVKGKNGEYVLASSVFEEGEKNVLARERKTRKSKSKRSDGVTDPPQAKFVTEEEFDFFLLNLGDILGQKQSRRMDLLSLLLSSQGQINTGMA